MVSLISQNASTPTEATEKVLERLARTRSNTEFLATLSKAEV
jgi:transcription termination factor Rho